MIPADRISFNDDGTAWLVGDEWFWGEWHVRDRPCDLCGGAQLFPDYGACPDCDGTGRHAFAIEVERYRRGTPDADGMTGIMSLHAFRVFVVEGMVLPIAHSLQWRSDMRCVEYDKNGEHVLWGGDGNDTPIALPPAAEPGMWAVKLETHS